MTYDEAVLLKKETGEQIIHAKLEMKVVIVPSENKDFTNYLTDCRSGNLTDKDSIRYSTDGTFNLYGLKVVGSDILKLQIG